MARLGSFLNKIQDAIKDYCKYKNVCLCFDPNAYTCANNESSYCGKYRAFEAEKTQKEAPKPEQA
jgi:hypothetical protein